MATINVGQVATTTLRKQFTDVVDNMSDNVPFYLHAKKRDNLRIDGGRDIVFPLDYAENSSFQWLN